MEISHVYKKTLLETSSKATQGQFGFFAWLRKEMDVVLDELISFLDFPLPPQAIHKRSATWAD
jgi:hypothetical protein